MATEQTTTTLLTPDVITLPTDNNSMKTTIMRVIDEKGEVNLSILSDEDKERYRKIGNDLVVTDINSISNYGSDLNNKMSHYSSELLSNTRASQCGEIGEHITTLLNELSNVNVNEFKPSSKVVQVLRKIPILNLFVKNIEKVLRKYDSIEHNVEEIAESIKACGIKALSDNTALQYLYEQNKEYGKCIEELIIAGKIRLDDTNVELTKMLENPSNYEPQDIQDMQEFIHKLDKRISDMIVLRYVIKQTLPQIRLVQNNNIAIANKADSIMSTTIPLWKNQLALAKSLIDQNGVAKVFNLVSNTTNTMIENNQRMLHETSVIVAKENERSIVDVQTLRKTTEDFINTILEIKQIHDEGMKTRNAEIKQLKELESRLDKAIANANTQRNRMSRLIPSTPPK